MLHAECPIAGSISNNLAIFIDINVVRHEKTTDSYTKTNTPDLDGKRTTETFSYRLSQLLPVSTSEADSMGHGAHVPPLLQMAGHWGRCEWKNSKQETDQTVLTTTKELTKTTNCTCRAKKWRGTTKNFFPALRAGSVPPTFALDRWPPLHFQIRSGATGFNHYAQFQA